jgi:hypothetical protein
LVSISYQEHSKCSSPHGSSGPELLSINKRRGSSRLPSSANRIDPEPVNIDENSELRFANLVTNQQNFYDQKHSTEVLTACISLGVDVPTSMQQALVDQHGRFKFQGYLSFTDEMDWHRSVGSQFFVEESATADWSWGSSSPDYGYTWRREDFHGDFTGIGAQFETEKGV